MQTYNKLATQISLPPSYIAPEDTGKISGTIWTEEVVLHSTTAASKSGEAMQRKMAQPFEAKHQGSRTQMGSHKEKAHDIKSMLQ